MTARHFLSLMDLDPEELRGLLARAAELKTMARERNHPEIMAGMTAALVFEKSSTRTRVSFETGIGHFGGKFLKQLAKLGIRRGRWHSR